MQQKRSSGNLKRIELEKNEAKRKVTSLVKFVCCPEGNVLNKHLNAFSEGEVFMSGLRESQK